MSVMAIFTLGTVIKEEAVEIAEVVETTGVEEDGKKNKGNKYSGNYVKVPYIWYLIIFRKKSVLVLALFDSNSEINAIHPTFAQELGLSIRLIDVGV